MFSQSTQSDELKNSDDNSMPALVARHNLIQDSSESEDKNLSNDSMSSLAEHPGSDSLSDNYKIPGNYTLSVLDESLDKSEVNLIVKLDEIQSNISMTIMDSSKSYGRLYLRECTVNLEKILYELHVEDEGYFSSFLGFFQNWQGF